MIDIQDVHRGDIVVMEDTAISGVFNGSVTVQSGYVDVRGVLNGPLTLNAGTRGRIAGVMNGPIANRGGILSIEGVLNGDVRTTNGETAVAPAAVVNGDVR